MPVHGLRHVYVAELLGFLVSGKNVEGLIDLVRLNLLVSFFPSVPGHALYC